MLLFMGGSSYFVIDDIDVYSGRAKEAIVDPEKRERAKDIFDQMEDTAKDRQKIQNDTIDQLYDLAANQDYESAEIDALMDGYFSDAEMRHGKFVELRSGLKKQVTREEWATIFAEPAEKDDNY